MAWEICSECGRCPPGSSCDRYEKDMLDSLIAEQERINSYLENIRYMIDENDIEYYRDHVGNG